MSNHYPSFRNYTNEELLKLAGNSYQMSKLDREELHEFAVELGRRLADMEDVIVEYQATRR